MSAWETILVARYFIGDDDEGVWTADNELSFEDTDKLLHELREAHPTVTYTMCAQIDA